MGFLRRYLDKVTGEKQKEPSLMLDFTVYENTLFSGRKNGRSWRKKFNLKPSKTLIIKATDEQIITSSFFLGLMGDVFVELISECESMEQLNKAIDSSHLNKTNKSELTRALKRCWFSERGL